MVRKSERNKSAQSAQATPEKVVAERGRKSSRIPKRKKKSSSESEGETEAHVEKETKEVGEITESKAGPPEADVPDGKQDGVRSRRSTRRHPVASESEKEPENDKPSEWKEDPTFWGTEEAAPAEKTIVDEGGTTWKIQSSNGSGGEIQKLKICRQRVSESTDASSPSAVKDASSPRRKKNKSNKNADDNSESGGDVASSNEGKSETKSESETEVKDIPINKTSEEESLSQAEEVKDPQPEVTEEPKEKNTDPPEPSEKPTEVNETQDEKVPDVVEPPPPPEGPKEEEEKVTNESEDQIKPAETKSRTPSVEGHEDTEKSRKSSTDDDPPKVSEITEEAPISEEKTETTEDVQTSESNNNNNNNNNVESRVRTKSETSEDGKAEKKLLSVSKVKVPVNSEVAMDEIAKKLNERAARFAKDLTENKEKKRDSTESGEPKSPREEGELTPVPEQLKKKHTTIVINKPKEITSQPTRLKRNTDELPPTERKRRILSKSKSKDKEEDPINISSQSLMLLVPEVKTITPEQVAAFPLDDEDLSKFELDQPVETKVKKKIIDLKPKEVEVRVQNDTRQVIKKKPIVIDTKENSMESKPVGPKLPVQENHRVVRKISLLSEDTKKPRRSPSPGGKDPTEVLFITNLVRPFTVPQLRELLARTGTIAPNGFYIDKIKSKCYVKYTDTEMAVETRHALNGVRWPVNNPKTLKVEFATAEDMAIVQKLADEETVTKKAEASSEPIAGAGWLSEQAALKPQRRVTAAVREWDMGKVGAGAVEEKRPPPEEWRPKQEPVEQKRRPISPVELKYEPPPRKVKKRDNDAPARLLDDLFRKTKATPCIYWLPLTAAQIAVKEEIRRQHMADHERKLAELRKSDHARRDKDREKSRDRRKK